MVPSARNSQVIQQPSGHHPQKKESGNFGPKDDLGNQAVQDQSKKDAAGDKKAKQLPLPLAGMETRTRKKRDGDQKADQKNPGEPAGGGAASDHGGDVDFADQHDDAHHHAGSEGRGHSHKADVHGTVGVALVAGFVLMLLVDQLAQQRTGRGKELDFDSL